MKKPSSLLIIFICVLTAFRAEAGTRFASSYPCSDSGKTCVSSGTRIVDGFPVHKSCWEWNYSKSCNYPSRDDCRNYANCYAVAELPCLLRDNYGNCVNRQKEFSCKSWEPVTGEKEIVRAGPVAKEGKERLICKGVPCMDGNCVDKSYLTDGDMLGSVSKLYAVSRAKGAPDLNFKLFEGFSQSCSKKAASYTNCCAASLKGWGNNLGAGCKQDERDLIDKRSKNLCVYVGKENKQTMGVTTVVKHHYCCFGSLFNKVFQAEGRKQLGIGFGSGGSPNCRGLTLEEITRLDFSKMDFSEFFAEILKRMKIPKAGDIEARVNSSMPKLRKYDGDPNNRKNAETGWNETLVDDSFEAEEERRAEKERREKELAEVSEKQRREEEKKAETKNRKREPLEKELKETENKLRSGHSSCKNCPTREALLKTIKELERKLLEGDY